MNVVTHLNLVDGQQFNDFNDSATRWAESCNAHAHNQPSEFKGWAAV
jgi:hypothetical protein